MAIPERNNMQQNNILLATPASTTTLVTLAPITSVTSEKQPASPMKDTVYSLQLMSI